MKEKDDVWGRHVSVQTSILSILIFTIYHKMPKAHLTEWKKIMMFKAQASAGPNPHQSEWSKTIWQDGKIVWFLHQDNRQSLVLVKLEELDSRRLTKEMKYLVSSLTYLAWPQNGRIRMIMMRNGHKSNRPPMTWPCHLLIFSCPENIALHFWECVLKMSP